MVSNGPGDARSGVPNAAVGARREQVGSPDGVESGSGETRARVVVIGAGVMGSGIAHAAVTSGAEVTLVDISQAQLENAHEAVSLSLGTGVARGKLDDRGARQALARLRTTTDLEEACAGSGIVIEAVVERIEVKHAVLGRAAAVASSNAIVATNTSALSITEVLNVLEDPSRGIGLHFFNPVPKMPLVEVVRGLQTTDATLHRADRWVRSLGKQTVHVQDMPGFVTSRINVLIGNESMRVLEEGVATPENLDAAIKMGLNHPMGPLELGDLVGWDTRLHILEYLTETLGDRFRPTNLHRRLVAAGRHGRKSGRGVYAYDEGRRTDEPSDLGRRPLT